MNLPQTASLSRISEKYREALAALSLAILYFGSGALFILLSRQAGSVAELWFGNAIALAFLLLAPARVPVLLAAALAGGLAANLAMGTPITPSAGFMAANLIEIAVAYYLVRSWNAGRPFRLEGDVRLYLTIIAAAAVVAPVAGGIVGALTANLAFDAPYLTSWVRWAEGGAIGAISALPVALLLTRKNLVAVSRRTPPVRLAVLAVVTLVSAVAPHFLPGHPQFLIAVPVLIAAVWTHPLVVAVTALTVLVSSTVAEATVGHAADLGVLMVTAAIAIVAPFSVSIVLQGLRDERTRFQQAMRESAVGMAELSPEGVWRDANQAMLDFLGYAQDEVPRLDWEEIVHADDRKELIVLRRRLMAGIDSALRMVTRCVRKDGSVVWGDMVGSVIRDNLTGEPRQVILQIVDVTARRATEQALADSEQRLAFALEAGGLGVWDHDIESGEHYSPRDWRALSGLPEDGSPQLDSTAWLARVHPGDLDRIVEADAALKSGRSADFSEEYRVRQDDGAWLWIHNAARVMEWRADGRPKRIIGLYRDISAARAARKAIEDAERRWAFALDSARQGVWDARLDIGRTYYSDMWKRMVGYEPDEVPDDIDAWKSFVHPDDLVRVEQANSTALSGEDLFEFEFRMRHKDGHWVWVLDRGKVIERDVDGQPVRMIGTHTDITERRQAEERMERLSQRVQLATKAGGVGLWEFDTSRDALWWDERMRALYGINDDRPVTYDDWARVLHPEDRKRAEHEVEDALAGRRPYDTEFRIILPDGETRYIRSMADPARGADGDVYLLVGTNWDVTETHRLTSQLADEKERLRVTLASIGDGVITTDTNGDVTFMNKVAELETGWLATEAVGRPVEEVFRLLDEWTEQPAASPVETCLATRRPADTQDEVILVNRSGERQDVRNAAAPILSAGGDLIGVVLVFQDVSRARRLQRQLSYSATHDALTDLRNRAAFERDLRAFVDETTGTGDVHSLCFVDLDRFKKVNDTCGHAAGDRLLKDIAAAMCATVRSVDVAARIGGDEFALLLRDCPPHAAVGVCEKIRDAIVGLDFTYDGKRFDVGASFGIAAIDGSIAPSEVLNAADAACYEAKASGHNNVRVHRPEADVAAAG